MGKPIVIGSAPGVKRDGTELEGKAYVDAQWCRFRRGLPRKMGGYRAISQNLVGPVNSISSYTSPDVTRIYFGSSNALEYNDLTTSSGVGAGVGNRTPAAFVPSDDNLWTFDYLWDGGGTSTVVMAHAAPNMSDIASSIQRKIWYGDAIAGSVLIDSTAPSVSGGVFCAPPYAFAYDSDGGLYWCVPNTPADWVGAGSGDARPTKNKIIYGCSVRGGSGVVPAFLLWSLNSLIRGTFVGGTPVFDFDSIDEEISILSSRCVVRVNGLFYWIGNGCFKVYNGVIQELPNDFNKDWFFDNLNRNHKQKIWGTVVPEWGEIQWHFPFGDSTICNRVLIYNYIQKIWYDNEVARSCGVMPDTMEWPIWVDALAVSQHTYVRPLNGTPTASGGVAANAFDGNPATSCAAGVDGDIIYDFGDGVSKTIAQVGITSNSTTTLDLIFEYCNDSGTVLTNWETFSDPASQSYTASIPVMFDATAVRARAWRVRETAGGTLDAQEVYFMAQGTIVHQHEFGTDAIVGGSTNAIESNFTTSDISFIDQGEDQWIGVIRMEPDFVQAGEMTVEVQGRRYARDSITSTTWTFQSDTQKLDMKKQHRLMRFKFISNTQGGYYELGQTYLSIEPGDARQ